MDWKIHTISSFTVYFLIMIIFAFSVPFAAAGLLVMLFFSMFPDIDHPKSMIRKASTVIIFYFAELFVFLCLRTGIMEKLLVSGAVAVLTYYLYKNLPVHHRGSKSLHRWRYAIILTPAIALAFIAAGLDAFLAAFVLIGYGLHLLLDKIRDF